MITQRKIEEEEKRSEEQNVLRRNRKKICGTFWSLLLGLPAPHEWVYPTGKDPSDSSLRLCGKCGKRQRYLRTDRATTQIRAMWFDDAYFRRPKFDMSVFDDYYRQKFDTDEFKAEYGG